MIKTNMEMPYRTIAFIPSKALNLFKFSLYSLDVNNFSSSKILLRYIITICYFNVNLKQENYTKKTRIFIKTGVAD